MTDIFDGANQQSTEATFDTLVGEGKKYSDANELAKAKSHADEHISALEAQLAQQAEDLAKAKALEEVVASLEANAQSTAQVEPQTTPDATVDVNAITEQAAANVMNTIEAKKMEDTAKANQAKVVETMRAKFGDSAQDTYRNAAAAAGMSVEDMNGLVRSNPTAAMKLLGVTDQPTSTGVSHPQGQSPAGKQVSPETNPATPEYWKKRRREDPTYYYSARGQKEMMKAMRGG